MAEGSIEGQVRSSDGPVPNAKLSIGALSTNTDRNGHFILIHVPPGIGKMRVEALGFHNTERDILVQTDVRIEDLSVILTEVTGNIEGTIQSESGEPLAEAEVSGIFRLRKPQMVAKTDREGHYSFEGIPVGEYRIRAAAKGYGVDGSIVQVRDGVPTRADFALRPGNLVLGGTVVGKESGIALQAEACLMRNGIVVGKFYSKCEDGKFNFANLVPDDYELEVHSEGHAPQRWRGRLDRSESVLFELEDEHNMSCSP